MGVKGLLTYLRKKHPNGVLYLKPSVFEGKRFAIDISTTMYREMAKCRNTAVPQMDLINKGYDEALVRKLWYEGLINSMIVLLESGVNPIIVFDGKATVMKGKEREKRAEKFRKKKEEIATAWKALEEADPLDKEAKKKELIDAYKNDTTINPADHDLMKIVMAASGLCCLQSKVEADHLVAMLCYHGEVALSYTIDSDMIPHLSPMMGTLMNQKDLKKAKEDNIFDPEKGEKYLRCYHLGYILESMRLTPASFIDLCCLFTIDYNSDCNKIKGLGPVKIEKLIREYKYIDDIPIEAVKKVIPMKNRENISFAPYDHINCRTEFSWTGLDELIAEFKVEDIDNDSDEELPEEITQHENEGGNASVILKEAKNGSCSRQDSSSRGRKLLDDEDDQVSDTEGDIEIKRPHLFGERTTRYQIVNNSDMRTAFELVQIEKMVPRMQIAIRHYLEKYPDDGEPGHIPHTWIPPKHVWTPDGKLYIDDELVAEF